MSGNSLMSSRTSRPMFKVFRQVLSLCLIARAHAAGLCASGDDQYLNNTHFSIQLWVRRGICIRSSNVEQKCFESLENSLMNLDKIRDGEYAGAASVLALLPTIGALLGVPTSEIWYLLTVVPFGGGLTMSLSFGGVMLPDRVEEYRNDLNRNTIAIERSVASRDNGSVHSDDPKTEIYTGLDSVLEKIVARMRQDESRQLAKGHLWVGLVGMVMLSVGAQAAMIVVEQGGVIGWWCVSRYWFHLWYFLVTITAILENRAHYPFNESWRLFLSDVPYDVNIQGGDSILQVLENPNAKARHVRRQLACLKAGTVTFHGSRQYTRPRNTVLVKVSVATHGRGRYRSLLQFLSRIFSIAAFVTGTALFASVQLLALPVAVMTLTLILAAGVCGRGITAWIVSGVSKTEPLIHVVVNTTQEAQHVIARVLSLDTSSCQNPDGKETRKIQAELNGHMFVSQRRVGRRSKWWRNVLGVLANPFDLTNVHHSETISDLSRAGTDQSVV